MTILFISSFLFMLANAAMAEPDGLRERELLPCINTADYGGKDKGCTIGKPICVYANGRYPPASVTGHHCAPCVHVFNPPEEVRPDFGCTEEKPYCVDKYTNFPNYWFEGVGCMGFNDCIRTASICIAIDESGSIGGTNFEIVKTFAKNLINHVQAAVLDGTEYGVVFFNDNPSIATPNLSGASAAKTAIDIEGYTGGGTNIGVGIGECTRLLNAAQFPNKIIITMTDGDGTLGTQATDAISAGITLVAVGVGVTINLSLISSAPNLIFPVTDFNSLVGTSNAIIAAAACH